MNDQALIKLYRLDSKTDSIGNLFDIGEINGL